MTGLPQHIAPLIIGFGKGTLSDNQRLALDEWIAASDQNKWLFQELTDTQTARNYLQEMELFDEAGNWEKISGQIDFSPVPVTPLSRRPWWQWAAAAAVLLALAGGFWMLSDKQPTGKTIKPEATIVSDVEAPKISKATITLADGRQVPLDSMATGTLATQGDVQVVRNSNGEIIYTGDTKEVQYNTLFNPRGSKVVQLTLHDGTRVWLNNESSITYPTAFPGKERKVVITGEAYFEVAHDRSKPFFVTKDAIQVEVLGTHFNINAFNDEEVIKVTLLEGSVKLQSKGSSSVLKPNQQAIIINDIKISDNVDLDAVMAWKNNYFHFNRADLPTVMRQLARWYDLDIAYEGKISQREFGGEIQRELPLSSTLRLLEKGNVHFRVQGRKLTVLP